MGTRMVMAVCMVLVPALVLLFGVLLRHRPPERNALFGYRTRRSMRSQETWDFAQRYVGRLWVPLGAVMLVLSAVVTAVFWPKDVDVFGKAVEIATYAQLALVVLTIPLTEHALKKKFDE